MGVVCRIAGCLQETDTRLSTGKMKWCPVDIPLIFDIFFLDYYIFIWKMSFPVYICDKKFEISVIYANI